MARFPRLARLVPCLFAVFLAVSCSRDATGPRGTARAPRPGPRRLADRLDPHRARHLQPPLAPRRQSGTGRCPHPRDARHARPPQSRHRRRRAVAGRKMDRRPPDGRSYTLTLRDGVTFSDGQPFTSADVVFTFQALYDPAVDSPVASARHGRRQAAAGHRSRSAHRRHHHAGAVRARHRAPRQRPHPAEAPAPGRARRPHLRRGVGDVDDAGGDGGFGPVHDGGIRARAADDLRQQSALLQEGRVRRRPAVPRSPGDGVRDRRQQDRRDPAPRVGRGGLHVAGGRAAGRHCRAAPAARPGIAAAGGGRRQRRSQLPVVQPHARQRRRQGQAVPAAPRVPPRDFSGRRSRRHRQHGVSRRRRPGLRSDHAGQQDVVSPRRRRPTSTIRRRRKRSSTASASAIATATACSTTGRGSR